MVLNAIKTTAYTKFKNNAVKGVTVFEHFVDTEGKVSVICSEAIAPSSECGRARKAIEGDHVLGILIKSCSAGGEGEVLLD